MAILFKTDGTVEKRIVKSLKDAQELVEGYIEVIKISNLHYVICNEDGLSKQLPKNNLSLALTGRELVGNILLILYDEFDGLE